jgi:hypothetical protein
MEDSSLYAIASKKIAVEKLCNCTLIKLKGDGKTISLK